MKEIIVNIGLSLLMAYGVVANVQGAESNKKTIQSDSIKVKTEDSNSGDRNVMLNAASANAGPRNVNIGLPASVGGTTVLENNLPVVYFFWPELPYKSWRMDAMTNNVRLMDLGQTAINVGDVGFSVGTLDNLGTDEFNGNVAFRSNQFGLLNGTTNISAPLTKNGLKFSLGAFANYDPGTYNARENGISRYLGDQTQLYKMALTQDYKLENVTGSISALYKFSDSRGINAQYAPYVYHLDGSVSELDGFKIGRDNYMATQTFTVKDAATGDIVKRNALDDYNTTSHTLDFIGKNRFENGLNFNYTVRLHNAQAGNYLSVMTGINEEVYNDDLGNTAFGHLQNVLVLASKKTPIKSMTSLFEVGKKSGGHDWKIGVNQWNYSVDKFTTEGATYKQTVQANPQLINGSERHGFNEYHNGSENKTAVFVTDKWNIGEVLTLDLGARLEYQNLRGDYINRKDIQADIPFLSNAKTNITKDWFNKAFMLSAVYKATNRFGLLGEAVYNEQSGHLESYSAGNDPNLKKSRIPEFGGGIFYNHSLFSLVSKATYITRNDYRSTVNFSSVSGNVSRETVSYDIATVGWTTDVVTNPFKNFNLHLLLTLQAPKYKNYSGTVNFADEEKTDYDFNNNYVTGVSKVLVEVDPSYQWNRLRMWASARYFSKEYANLTNSLFFKGRWETFAGANYNVNKKLELNATVVNLLNQRGAKGSISGADLLTHAEAEKMEGAVLSGTYIRPFTVEFGLKYKF